MVLLWNILSPVGGGSPSGGGPLPFRSICPYRQDRFHNRFHSMTNDVGGKNACFVCFLSVSVFKSILFSTNAYLISDYLQDSDSSVETYRFLTPGVRIFSSHMCKLRGGWVGQSEFAHCANQKNRTQKWTAP